MDIGARLPVAFRGVMEAEAFVEAVSGVHPGGAGEDERGATRVARVFDTGAHERAADASPLCFWRDGKDAQFGFVGTAQVRVPTGTPFCRATSTSACCARWAAFRISMKYGSSGARPLGA